MGFHTNFLIFNACRVAARKDFNTFSGSHCSQSTCSPHRSYFACALLRLKKKFSETADDRTDVQPKN